MQNCATIFILFTYVRIFILFTYVRILAIRCGLDFAVLGNIPT